MNFLKKSILVLFLITFFLSIIIDIKWGIYTSWTYSFLAAGIGSLLAFFILNNRALFYKVISPLVVFSIIYSVHFIDYNKLKPFLRTFYSLNPEMTEAQVVSKMNDYEVSGQGDEYVILGKNDELEYVHDNKNEYDLKLKYIVFVPRNNTKEYGIVYFLDNKLYRKEVHHDF